MSSTLLEQQFELVAVDKLQPHPDNPRKGSVDGIAKSIAANGFYRPVVVQKSSSRILAGNHSWEAAKAEGLKKIPVVWVDVDDKQALKILLADNKTSDDAVYDELALAQILLEARAGGNLDGTGYSELDLGELFKSMGDEILKAAGPGDEDGEQAPKSGGYKEQYGVIVMCQNEAHQQEVFDQLVADGRECKIVVT